MTNYGRKIIFQFECNRYFFLETQEIVLNIEKLKFFTLSTVSFKVVKHFHIKCVTNVPQALFFTIFHANYQYR